jgi:peptidyl-prolyl cis-trans isomerase C
MIRARILLGAGLLLAFGAVAPFAATVKKPVAKPAAPTAANDSDVVLVRIGKDVITRRVIADRLQEIPENYRAQYQTPDGRMQLMQRLIEERVWLQDAESHGVAARPDLQRQLASSRRDLYIRTWVGEQMAQSAAPSDSEAKVYYDEHQADFKTPANVSLRHIQLKTEAEARKVLALAKVKGADFNALALKFSTDSLTRSNGGSLGSVTRDGAFTSLGTQPALAESAMALGDGGIGGPYHTPKGWSIFKVDAVHPEATRGFDQVHSFITRTLTQQRQSGYYNDLLGKAKSRIGVSPDSAAIKNFLSTRKTAREMFQDAQQAGAPQLRIDAYRKVVADYPDADISPQALFMVGFVYSEELKNFDEAEKAFKELLVKYPKSELTASASWMVDHMRSEEAPSVPGADSLAAAPAAGKGTKR